MSEQVNVKCEKTSGSKGSTIFSILLMLEKDLLGVGALYSNKWAPFVGFDGFDDFDGSSIGVKYSDNSAWSSSFPSGSLGATTLGSAAPGSATSGSAALVSFIGPPTPDVPGTGVLTMVSLALSAVSSRMGVFCCRRASACLRPCEMRIRGSSSSLDSIAPTIFSASGIRRALVSAAASLASVKRSASRISQSASFLSSTIDIGASSADLTGGKTMIGAPVDEVWA